MNNKTKWETWHDQNPHTHPDITDPLLRSIFANELLIIRRVCRQMGESPSSDSMKEYRYGMETAFRRMEAVNKHGLKAAYWQNYGVQGDAKGAENEANIHE